MAETRAPRTFFLNESHEHARGEKEGGGRVPQYTRIDWQAKGDRIAKSLRAARTLIRKTPDPVRESHFFMLSTAESKVEKISKDKKKAIDGRVAENVHLAGEHARIFQRLGIDLLGVTSAGAALVHADADRVDQLIATAAGLVGAGAREQSRWALLSEFQPAPADTRADPNWISTLPTRTLADVIVELQPLLTRAEVEAVARALRESLTQTAGEEVTAAGRDFSGRSWIRMSLPRKKVALFADQFQSIQSIHSPLRSPLFAASAKMPPVSGGAPLPPPTSANLPAVAIVDSGVPRGHPILSAYRRGEFRHAAAGDSASNDHASRVASRVVFGDVDASRSGYVPPAGQCQFLDVVVPAFAERIGEVPIIELDDKAIQEVIGDVARNYPDVRVFDFSFGSYQPLKRLDEVRRRERLVELQDLDNFIFANDVLVVVAAGNSPLGAVPNQQYPGHAEEPDWGLGAWACGFNTLVVGSYVGQPHPDGLAGNTGWPSPFTRIGPGLANAPVPNFAASGGDSTKDYGYQSPLGVWTCGRTGLWEDAVGTSFAAPIVAREAAILLQQLQRQCAPGVPCFASTARAFLWLVARPAGKQPFPPLVRDLARLTLGQGLPRADRLFRPDGSNAVLVWQGTLEDAMSIARIRVPVPPDWLTAANQPSLRVVCAWNTPVSAAAPDVWASRHVTARLKPTLGADAIHGTRKSYGTYPIIDRVWRLDREDSNPPSRALASDEWVIELSYEDVGPYPATLLVAPQQKVSLVMELFDDSSDPVSPQEELQKLPIAHTMIRLAGVPREIQVPVKIRV